jgi:prevent-host-death family protein
MKQAERVPIRRLQQHASELIARVEAGERLEITRNGRLVAVLSAPDPEEAAWERLVAEGAVDPASDRRGALADWRTPRGTPGTKLSEALEQLRADESER